MRTEQGKNTSSQNATKHGCCSEKHLIVGDERIEDFHALESTWRSSYKSRDAAEHHMIELLTRADWFFQRAERTLAHVEAELIESGSPTDWSEAQEKKLLRIQRYHTARNNALTKAKKAIEDYRKNRTAETVKAEKHEIVKQQAKRKDAKDMTVEECIRELEELGELRRRSG